ncbi:MAG: hypothetical protein QOJ11_3861 [Frankiales bacterium]|jgi:hypothetical protein|nr:hypothetical protein [Frankiales bacterium]
MNDLENQLHDALHASREHTTSGLSGPALRRTARRRTFRARTGGVAVVGAAAVAGVVVAPGLLDTSTPGSPGASVGGQTSAASKSAGADPVGKSQPMASFTAKATPTAVPSSTGKSVPVQAYVWSPAGSLIDDATVLAVAPKVAATDSDWKAWGGQLLEQDTVSVVFADRAPLDPTAQYPHPLVIVTGRTSADSPTLRIAALTTIEAGADRTNLNLLTVQAMTMVPADGPQAIAVSNGMTLYVVAEVGVDSATYTYTDATGQHTAAMKVADGLAVATVPMADLKASTAGEVTGIKAYSHGKVIWDAAPVAGR